MTLAVEIGITRENLPQGTGEERATFGCLTLRAGPALLTEGFDHFIQGYRPGPLVSGYHAAEWFLWNWWRLGCESRSASPDWFTAHCMASIGEGYVWPNITIWSDGERTALLSKPSAPETKPFRYAGGQPVIVPSDAFETALDGFVTQIRGRLQGADLRTTNVDRLWSELIEERGDPELGRYRRIEATLGFDPGDADEDLVLGLIADDERFGRRAVGEIAAEIGAKGRYPDQSALTRPSIAETAAAVGADLRENDGIGVPVVKLPRPGNHEPAWRVGRNTAATVRTEAGLSDGPVSNERLAAMAGTLPSVLDWAPAADLSFVLRGEADNNARPDRLVLRSKWEAGRRFDLTRLIGDRLLYGQGEALSPATRSGTYRQKAQRAFAAELLAPIAALKTFLKDDFSEDAQREAADHFKVSPMAVQSHLMNNGVIARDGDGDFPEPLAA